jgi:hypothetical protein
MAAWQHGSMAAWQHGSMAAWQHGSMAAWQHGSMEEGEEEEDAEMRHATYAFHAQTVFKTSCETPDHANEARKTAERQTRNELQSYIIASIWSYVHGVRYLYTIVVDTT